MTTIILGVLLLLAVVAFAFMYIRYRKSRRDYLRISMMMENLNSYAFLIDDQFEVKETNYYALNPAQQRDDNSPRLLGNVLHCTTACESGTCGTGLECKHCPVRFVISKSFERKNDFSDLEVSMELSDSNQNVADVDVNVGGRYISVEGQPYMVINVKDITESKRLLRRYIDQSLAQESNPDVPKLLFATQNVGRFNHLREKLKKACRVIYADSVEQIVRRIGKGKDYGYSAALFDETFLHAHDVLDQINEHIVIIKLTTDGETGIEGRLLSIPTDISDEELKKLISRHFQKS